MTKIYYAVKMVTAFGTYTMGTYETREQAEEHVTEAEAKGFKKGSYRVSEVDGIYNGNIKIA